MTENRIIFDNDTKKPRIYKYYKSSSNVQSYFKDRNTVNDKTRDMSWTDYVRTIILILKIKTKLNERTEKGRKTKVERSVK